METIAASPLKMKNSDGPESLSVGNKSINLGHVEKKKYIEDEVAEEYIRVAPERDESLVDHLAEQPSEEASIHSIINELNSHVEVKRGSIPGKLRSVSPEQPLNISLERHLLQFYNSKMGEEDPCALREGKDDEIQKTDQDRNRGKLTKNQSKG